jgi:hypothetical protein
MEETKLICGQCNKDIVESGDSYFEINSKHTGIWYQCFDCYCEEQDYINSPDEDQEWDEEE